MSKLIERLRAATCNSMHPEMNEAADCIARLTEEVSRLRASVSTARGWLQYYADGSHFIQHDPTAWDTVSGEPANFQEDEAATATVEDGSMAKLALMQMDGFVHGIPKPGEFQSLYAAYQAQQHAGVLASSDPDGYAAAEKEHLGDPLTGTGIYAPSAPNHLPNANKRT